MCDWERNATFKTYSFGEDFMFEVFVLMLGARAIFSVRTTDIFPSGEKKRSANTSREVSADRNTSVS